MSRLTRRLVVLCFLLTLAVLSVMPGHTQGEDDEPGEYLAVISGCMHCHSPVEGPVFSGGVVQWNDRIFYAPNLTPARNGPAVWDDEAVRRAITTGIAADNRQLAPVMPYLYYNGMADADVGAVVGFINGLEPVETDPQPVNNPADVLLPTPPDPTVGVNRPDPVDQVAYGRYLVQDVMACGRCHTPSLPDGQPAPSRLLVGGQAFSGEWGIVYASNLTPSRVTGIGTFRDEEIILAIVDGQHPDGRPIYAMPWQAYSDIAAGDIQAVMVYLRSLSPIDNEVPPAELREGYEYYPATRAQPVSPLGVAVAILALLLAGAAVIYMAVQQTRRAQHVRQTDWVAYFDDVFSQTSRPSPDTEDNQPEEPPA
ncbi:MAG: hypothetical protein JXB30_11430 [Anaerolineae bacterium]|nr:hypothetical protein [Anaerolineae bacterium]